MPVRASTKTPSTSTWPQLFSLTTWKKLILLLHKQRSKANCNPFKSSKSRCRESLSGGKGSGPCPSPSPGSVWRLRELTQLLLFSLSPPPLLHQSSHAETLFVTEHNPPDFSAFSSALAAGDASKAATEYLNAVPEFETHIDNLHVRGAMKTQRASNAQYVSVSLQGIVGGEWMVWFHHWVLPIGGGKDTEKTALFLSFCSIDFHFEWMQVLADCVFGRVGWFFLSSSFFSPW